MLICYLQLDRLPCFTRVLEEHWCYFSVAVPEVQQCGFEEVDHEHSRGSVPWRFAGLVATEVLVQAVDHELERTCLAYHLLGEAQPASLHRVMAESVDAVDRSRSSPLESRPASFRRPCREPATGSSQSMATLVIDRSEVVWCSVRSMAYSCPLAMRDHSCQYSFVTVPDIVDRPAWIAAPVVDALASDSEYKSVPTLQ